MANIICINCMKGTLNEQGICNVCGKSDSAVAGDRRYLPPRTILRGKYLIGEAIGGGGFGITYLAFDLDLEIRVAIKEFFPRDFVGRDTEDRLTLLPYEDDCSTFFEAEKEKFINEAKRLAKFRGKPGIVSVLDYFQENGTAYIVMEYIEGATLRAYHMATGAALDVQTVLRLMKPVIAILDMVHQEGIIHRDISPDNIMINPKEEKVYLIDFGTAREASLDGERSLSVYMKHGYTPAEQRSRHGVQGPWTDVYALCATIYRCITNRYVPEVNDRIFGEELIKPSDMGIAISPQVEAALLHGLAIKPEDRIQSMAQLMFELYGGVVVHADNEHEPYGEEVKETNESGYQSAVVKKAPEFAPDKLVQIFEEGNKKAEEQKEKNKYAWLKKLMLFGVLCIGIVVLIYGLNGTYRKDSDRENSDYYSMVHLQWGSPSRIEYFSDAGKKVATTSYYKNSEDNKMVSTILNGDGENHAPTCWVEYKDEKMLRACTGSKLAEVVEYNAESDYVIQWWEKGYTEEDKLIGTITVKNGVCESNILNSENGLTGYAEYRDSYGLIVKWVNSSGEIIEEFIFIDDNRMTMSYYSWFTEKHYTYNFYGEDKYFGVVTDNTGEETYASYYVISENI